MVWQRRAKPPGEFLCRDFESHPVAKFAIRDSQFEMLVMCWRDPSGRGDWLKPSCLKVRILPPAPQNFEFRISNFESQPGDEIRDSQFAIRNSHARSQVG